SVQVSNVVPGFKCITGGWPPKVYFNSSCFGMYWTVWAKETPTSKIRHKHAFPIIVAPFSCPPPYVRTLEPPCGIDLVVPAWRYGCNLPGSPSKNPVPACDSRPWSPVWLHHIVRKETVPGS